MNPDSVHHVVTIPGGFAIEQGGMIVDDAVYEHASDADTRSAYLNRVEEAYYPILTAASQLVMGLMLVGVHRLDAEALLARAVENIAAADAATLETFAA